MPATSNPIGSDGPPACVLLATDLSCRCDRALDRAVQLVRTWHASLHILHVVEGSDPQSRPATEQAAIAEREIRAAMGHRHIPFSVVLDRGNPADAIMRQVGAVSAGLVVTGIARDETFGRNVLGNTVEKAIRHATVPVLVAKTRPHGPYRNIVVGTDFSDPSRQALETAIGLFPDATFTLMHAFHVPFEGFADRRPDYLAEYRADLRREAEAFLSALHIPDATRDAVNLVIEHGEASALLESVVQTQPVDLVVLGAHRHGDLFSVLFGSTAEYLLSVLSCDILIVRETRKGHRSAPTAPRSSRSGRHAS